jgi:uncharacterized phage protein (TIGR01671 family)
MLMKTRAWDGERFRDDYVVMPDGSIHRSFKVDNGVEFMEFYEIAEQVNWKLSRFTGLLDKNGKEIYEDDILKVTNHDFEVNPNDSDTGYGSVEWLDIIGGWYIDKIHNSLAGINLDYHIEVIGNVFQNPELLEEVNK